MSFSRFGDNGLQDIDLEEEIRDKSQEYLKNCFYHYVVSTLLAEALDTDRHVESMSIAKYKFAFVVASLGDEKGKIANNLKNHVSRIKRTVIIG